MIEPFVEYCNEKCLALWKTTRFLDLVFQEPMATAKTSTENADKIGRSESINDKLNVIEQNTADQSDRIVSPPLRRKTTCEKHDLVQSGKSSLKSWPDVKLIPQTNKQTCQPKFLQIL